MTYEVNLDNYIDTQERKAVEIQVAEYGQSPNQLFNLPHPKKFTKDLEYFNFGIIKKDCHYEHQTSLTSSFRYNINKQSSENFNLKHSESTTSLKIEKSKLIEKEDDLVDKIKHLSFFGSLLNEDLKKFNAYKEVQLSLDEREFKKLKMHKNSISSLINICESSNNIVNSSLLVAGSSNGFIKFYDSITEKTKQLINVGNGLSVTALGKTGNSIQVAVATNDFKIQIYNTAFASLVNKFHAHDDTITGLKLCSQNNYLISSAQDCTYKFWDLNSKIPVSMFYDTEDRIISSDINSNGLYMCMDKSGVIVLRPVAKSQEVKIIKQDNSLNEDFHSVKFSTTNEYHYFVSTSKYLKVYDMRNFLELDCNEQICDIKDFIESSKYLLALRNTNVDLYSVANNMVSDLDYIKSFPINNPTCIDISDDKNIYVGTESGDVHYSYYRKYSLIGSKSDEEEVK